MDEARERAVSTGARREPNAEARALLLPDTIMPAGLTLETARLYTDHVFLTETERTEPLKASSSVTRMPPGRLRTPRMLEKSILSIIG